MRLIDSFDGLLLDLDGTVWAGSRPIEHATTAIAATNVPRAFITNNASRSTAEVAKQLRQIGLSTPEHRIVSSPEVAVELLREDHNPGTRIMVLGSDYLKELCALVGFRVVSTAADYPAAVVQGHNPATGWEQLSEAALAIRAGADYVATNRDFTLPSDRGLLVGNGSMVAAVVSATGIEPRNAGKPAPAMLEVAAKRLGASRPLVVGDRLDTDILAGANAAMPTLAVLTGVATPTEIIFAPKQLRPTFVAPDLRGLLADPAAVTPAQSRPGWQASITKGELYLSAEPEADPHDGLLVAAGIAWAASTVTRIRAVGSRAKAIVSRWEQ